MYIYLYIYRICTSCIKRESNVYADVHTICLTYIFAHAWCSTTPVNACRLSAKMHMDSCMCTYANGAAASLSWKLLRTYLESCANIVQAIVYHLPSCRSPVARRCSLQKSVHIYASSWRSCRCGVAQASSDHSRWCRPHPVCLWVALALGERRLPVTEMCFHHFRAGFLVFNSFCTYHSSESFSFN